MKDTFFAALLLLTLCSFANADFYVAPNGNDENPGTKSKPFATLERARDAIRVLKESAGLPSGGITVWIRGGDYQRDSTFQLTAEDSGTKESPIVYRSYFGERVRLIGGLKVKGFKPLNKQYDPSILPSIQPKARSKIFTVNLRELGVADFGKLSPRGFGRTSTPAHLELFFNGIPMTLARWPNDAWTKIADVPNGPQGGKFTYHGSRPSRWSKAADIWLHGYWTWDWADSYVKVRAIDTRAKEIITEEPHGVYGYKAGARYYALNLLEELDQPGEYYIDRVSGILYFWPPGPLDKAEVMVSLLEQPIMRLESVQHLTVRGLTFECTRGNGIEIKGCSDVLIAGCTLSNIGNTAVVITGSVKSGVLSCNLSHIGDTGISISCGDRQTLNPGQCFAVNNYIRDFSRWTRTYHPAISLHGVGNRAAHNLICYAPHSAILFGGNDHIMEFNEVHHVCMETSDAGAFYAGRDFSWQGNVIRYNFFHHMGTADVRSVYLDDNLSGVQVYGNVFYKAKMGVCIGGGRNNVVENNIFVDCEPSVHIDNRGQNWAKPTVDGYMKQQLEAVPYRELPWKERYPMLLTIYDDDPGAPKYNKIERNISFGGKWLNIYSKNYDSTISIKDNLVDVDPCFVDAASMKFQLKDDSPAFKLGFKRIPFEKIGLYKDKYRRVLPPK